MHQDSTTTTHGKISAWSTGSLSLDIALGVGGFPHGHIIEIFGSESSGKTTLTLQAIAELQRNGGVAAFVDAECALDPAHARNLGVNITTLLCSSPTHGEQGLAITRMLVRSGAVDLVVIDSAAALVPRVEIDGRIGSHRGAHSQLISRALETLNAMLKHSKTVVIFINQIRIDPTVVDRNPEFTTGGTAFALRASMRLDLRRVGSIMNGKEVVGDRVRVRIVKNTLAPAPREAEFDSLYTTGINREADILDQGLKYGILENSRVHFRYRAHTLGQDREQACHFLLKNPRLCQTIAQEVREIAVAIEFLPSPKPSPSRRNIRDRAIEPRASAG
jgi:recombination protein RecA